MRAITVRKFWERVVKDDCWLWTGRLDEKGYGRTYLMVDGVPHTRAHRIAYFLITGRWHPELDHLCRNRRCVNPDHLEPVTHRENMSRSSPAVKLFCVKGHPLAGDNLYTYPDGRRSCRICRADAMRSFYDRHSEGVK